MTEVDFPEKFLFALKIGKKGPKWNFLQFSQSFAIMFCWKEPKMKDITIPYFPVKTSYLGENSSSQVIDQKALSSI